MNKIWFTEDETGNIYWNCEDGRTDKAKPIDEDFFTEKSEEFKKEMQRGRLYCYHEAEYEEKVVDLTGFACDMATVSIEAIYTKDDGSKYLLVASTVNSAEKCVFPYIDATMLEKVKENVLEFYKSEKLQKKWQSLILRPICFLVNIETKEFELVSLSKLKKKNFKEIRRRPVDRIDEIKDYTWDDFKY